MRLMCGVGMGFEGNIVEVEVGGTVIGGGVQTAGAVLSPANLNTF